MESIKYGVYTKDEWDLVQTKLENPTRLCLMIEWMGVQKDDFHELVQNNQHISFKEDIIV